MPVKNETYEDYFVDWHEDVVVFTLNAPNTINALTKSMVYGLSDCVDRMPEQGVRALIISAEGRGFSSGTDLREAAEMGEEAAYEKANFMRDLLFRIHSHHLTSIAAINGLALGGGLELALACTFRVASPNASFGLTEVKLGVIPAYGGTQFLPAIIGKPRAIDLIISGRKVQPDEALMMGLINRICDAEKPVLDAALDMARQVTANSQFTIRHLRRCIEMAGSEVTQEGLDFEKQVGGEQGESTDAREGIKAFLEKRKPNYRHY